LCRQNPATARIELALFSAAVAGLKTLQKQGILLEDSVATAAATGLLEVGALFELALLAGVEGFNGTVIAHYAGVDGALGALGFMLGKNLLIGLNNRLYFGFHDM
jgi:hypothetical protein